MERFALEVIGKINVNITDPDYEIKVFTSEIMRYAAQSKLTPAEFFLARAALSRGYLTGPSGEVLKAFKKIDFEMFNEVEEAYLRYKVENKQYEAGREQIKAFLNPPPKEPTPEERKAKVENIIQLIKDTIARTGSCEFAFIIYEEMSKRKDFQKYRAEFPAIYDELFNQFLIKEKRQKLFYNNHELKAIEERHPEVMEKLKNKTYKKSDLVPLVLQLTKNTITENYIKQC